MTRYVLPDGTQAESLHGACVARGAGQWVNHPSLGPILLAADKLTEVPPSLPEEPPNGFLGVGGDDVWERDDLAEEEGDMGEGEHWWRMSDPQAHTWAYVAERNPQGLIRLIQDPADDAPELPKGSHLAFTIYHETEWWQALPPHQLPNGGNPCVQVAASAKGQGGGVDWEFGVVQTEPGALKLTMHDDAWPAFAQIPRFFAELSRRGNLMALGDVVVLLIQLGAVDETERSAAREARRIQEGGGS